MNIQEENETLIVKALQLTTQRIDKIESRLTALEHGHGVMHYNTPLPDEPLKSGAELADESLTRIADVLEQPKPKLYTQEEVTPDPEIEGLEWIKWNLDTDVWAMNNHGKIEKTCLGAVINNHHHYQFIAPCFHDEPPAPPEVE